jgi:hypothetical protein
MAPFLTGPDIKKFMKDIYADFNMLCKGLEGTEEANLHWNQEEFVRNKFKTTLGQIVPVRARVYQESRHNPSIHLTTRTGFPTYKDILTEINVPFRFTGGGKPLPAVESDRKGNRVSFAQTENTASISLLTTKDSIGSAMPLLVKFHRLIPLGEGENTTLVKTVTFHAELNSFNRWDCSLIIVVDEHRKEVKHKGGTCMMNLGFRSLGDSIGIGQIIEDGGNTFNLEMSLLFDNRNTRHTGRGHYLELADCYANRIGKGLEDTKNRIANLLHDTTHEFIQKKLKNIRLVRNTGLKAIRHVLESLERTPMEEEAFSVLGKWAAEDERLTRSLTDVFHRLVGRRRWWYQNLAAQLCEQYSTITLSNLDLDSIAQKADSDLTKLEGDQASQEYARRKASRYRAAASLSEFKHWLVNAARKTGTTVIDPDEQKRKIRKPVAVASEAVVCEKQNAVVARRA